MSIRCSGVDSRSFIIGSKLWPPAMIRASGPSRSRAAIAPSTLVARSYSNGAGVCNSGTTDRATLARSPDVLALLVLDRSVGADHRRLRQVLGARMANGGIELTRRQAAGLDVAEHLARRTGGGDRGL